MMPLVLLDARSSCGADTRKEVTPTIRGLDLLEASSAHGSASHPVGKHAD